MITTAIFRKKRFWLIIVLLVFSLFLITDVYRCLLPPLEIGESVEAGFGDVILVPGGGLREGLKIGYSTEERLNLAVELFKQRPRMILVSDGSLYSRSPGIDKVLDFLNSRGVSDEFIILEGKSQTTYDNVLNSQSISKRRGFVEMIVCTSPYHQKRTALMLRSIGLKKFRVAQMGRSEIYQAGSLRQRLRNIRLILREYLAILKFKILKK